MYALFYVPANTAQYAHFVFNTLDQDRSGLLSFEVRTIYSGFLLVIYIADPFGSFAF